MTQEMKEPRVQCSMCKDWKPRSDFHVEKSKPLGVQSRCKFCKKKEKELKEAGLPGANPIKL